MKKILCLGALAISLSVPVSASAGDACGTVLCLGGILLGGSNPSECNDHIKDYFSIVKKKKGSFSASRTANARMDYLDQCESEENEGNKKSINDKWGGVRGNPF